MDALICHNYLSQTGELARKMIRAQVTSTVSLQRLAEGDTPWITVCPRPGFDLSRVESNIRRLVNNSSSSDTPTVNLSTYEEYDHDGLAMQYLVDMLAASMTRHETTGMTNSSRVGPEEVRFRMVGALIAEAALAPVGGAIEAICSVVTDGISMDCSVPLNSNYTLNFLITYSSKHCLRTVYYSELFFV